MLLGKDFVVVAFVVSGGRLSHNLGTFNIKLLCAVSNDIIVYKHQLVAVSNDISV